jgi:hypothetical protein
MQQVATASSSSGKLYAALAHAAKNGKGGPSGLVGIPTREHVIGTEYPSTKLTSMNGSFV